jgi:hypothetical protein
VNLSGWDKFREQAEAELSQIRELLQGYGPLLEKCENEEPDFVECGSLGGMVHSFYGGIENILERVTVEIDNAPLKGDSWHKALLASMRENNSVRTAVISESMLEKLKPYLGFRHFYRNNYATKIQWAQLDPLVKDCPNVLSQFESEIQEFLKQAPSD